MSSSSVFAAGDWVNYTAAGSTQLGQVERVLRSAEEIDDQLVPASPWDPLLLVRDAKLQISTVRRPSQCKKTASLSDDNTTTTTTAAPTSATSEATTVQPSSSSSSSSSTPLPLSIDLSINPTASSGLATPAGSKSGVSPVPPPVVAVVDGNGSSVPASPVSPSKSVPVVVKFPVSGAVNSGSSSPRATPSTASSGDTIPPPVAPPEGLSINITASTSSAPSVDAKTSPRSSANAAESSTTIVSQSPPASPSPSSPRVTTQSGASTPIPPAATPSPRAAVPSSMSSAAEVVVISSDIPVNGPQTPLSPRSHQRKMADLQLQSEASLLSFYDQLARERVAAEAEAKVVAQAAEAKRIADEISEKEAAIKRAADEEIARLKREAEEVETKRAADEQNQFHGIGVPVTMHSKTAPSITASILHSIRFNDGFGIRHDLPYPERPRIGPLTTAEKEQMEMERRRRMVQPPKRPQLSIGDCAERRRVLKGDE